MKSRNKSEEIKVRVEPRMKLDLEDIAVREQLDLSDIARRALADYVRRVNEMSHAEQRLAA